MVLVSSLLTAQDQDETPPMSFFLTSTGTGDGANLGGLAGVDKYCQTLAEAAGSQGKTWRAIFEYASKRWQSSNQCPSRIGKGP